MERRAVWILNLDAELEWSGHNALPDALSGLPEAARAAARALLGEHDVPLEERDVPPGAGPDGPAIGRAWCPTRSTQARFRAAGIEPEPTPDLDVVRRANERGTWAQRGLIQGDCHWVQDQDELDAILRSHATGSRLRAKRLFTVAGRGQLRITVGSQSAADRGWIRRAFALGGLTLEPEREVLREWSMHGRLTADGDLSLGLPVRQVLQSGHWIGSRPATELSPEDRATLLDRTQEVAEVLRDMAYFGPFGIDAMHVRDAGGKERFLPLTEVNARYTLSYHESGLS